MPNALDDVSFFGFYDAEERVSRFVGMTRSRCFYDICRIGFGYPSVGCIPAEPTSVSPKLCFSLSLAQVFAFVVRALVGEDYGFSAFEHVALLPVGLV